MSPVSSAPPVARRLRLQLEEPAVGAIAPPRRRETLALFAGTYVLYAALGLYTTLRLHVVVGDAESRLAHAYFVWWNEPPKLAAIGFVWPPLQTIALLPLAAIRPLATSLAALPLTSAAFGALLVAYVATTLRAANVPPAARWTIVAATALNPVVVYYAGNGMAEIMYFALLAAGLHHFVQWTRTLRWEDLTLTALAFGVGTLLRYEVGLWLGLVLVGAMVVLARRRDRTRLEGALLVLAAPAVFGLMLWTYLNWTILGDAAGFLTEQFPARPPEPTPSDFVGLAREAVTLNLVAFPAAAVVAVGALVVAAVRREPLALVFAGFVVLNAAAIVGLIAVSLEPALLELRYNIRAIPVAVIVLGWLLSVVPRRRRAAAAAAAAAVVLASAPVSGLVMARYSFTIGERPFLVGLATGKREDKTGTSLADQREMADAIARVAIRKQSVLTDDAATFGVVLADGHPERYFDRIDRGDVAWTAAARAPQGEVEFFLVRRLAAGGPVDRLRGLYPLLDRDEPPPFLRPVHANETYALYAVVSGR